ncbi:hypothetical protein L3Y34_004717 [Caenorhabditis briggsae]|uniref:BTB domain-containing protein n=1 Tax=Caenorhabditis briggsae TaxID=6238 RepID=A0AAE9D558_CAEBR|nr:hypothetical protein L3Y34_004717 [Caenorhabditis briggsae]
MGTSQSHSRTPSREPLPNGHQVMDVLDPTDKTPRRGRKRKTGKGDEIETKKIAKLNTCAYVYQKLFLEGEDSDITIAACGREWKVHKLYLKQTKFFEMMLEGSWAESKSGRIDMEITDPNIDADGLNAVFGSLYHNEIEIDLEKIEGTVAAASYIVLDSVRERCAEMMISALSTDNAVRYYELSTSYGLDYVREKSIELILHQFWKILSVREKLREVSHDLLETILTSPNMFTLEGEYDLYQHVLQWIYMKENPDCNHDEPNEQFNSNIKNFFKTANSDFLLMKYVDIISKIRMGQILIRSDTITTIKNDGLIPIQIVDGISSQLWFSLLQNEENPKPLEMSDDEFFETCNRLGRSLDSFPKCWRWVGYNSGVDIMLHVNDYSVCIIRNCLNRKTPYSVNLKSAHVLHFRLVICDFKGQISFDTGRTSWAMKPDETKTVFRLNEDISTPISVHFQYLIHKPIDSSTCVKKYVEELKAKNNGDVEP